MNNLHALIENHEKLNREKKKKVTQIMRWRIEQSLRYNI